MSNFQTYYSGKTILVTGGCGAIGRNLVKQLVILGAAKVIVLDNLSSSYLWNLPNERQILFINGDICNDNDLRLAFHHRPTIIFHLAAFFGNQNSVDYPLLSETTNAFGTVKLLEYAVLVGNIERFVYTNSEGGAYGADSPIPHSEKDISYKLSSPYYISKMAAESYCHYYHSQYQLPVSIVRLFNSYGPGEVPGQYRNVIPNFIYWAMQGKSLPLTGSKEIARDFVYVADTVEGILRAGFFNDAIGTAVNIATNEENFIYDIAELINSKTGNPSGVSIRNPRNWDTRPNIIGINSKCQEILEFKPGTDFEQGLDFTINWFKDNWDNIDKSAAFNPGLNRALDT